MQNGIEILDLANFLKFIFECVINTAPLASSSVYGREKWLKCHNFTGSIIQWQRGPVICAGFSLNIFLYLVLDFFVPFFSFRLFRFILTADYF